MTGRDGNKAHPNRPAIWSAPGRYAGGRGPSPSVRARGVSRLVVTGCLAVAFLSACSTGTIATPDTGGDANVIPPAWTPPSGFTLSTEPGVAYRWATGEEFDCDIADRCWGMVVVPESGCASLYVELSIIDDAGTNVGYTNDVASGVAAGQEAKLVFDNFEDGATKARLSKVSCH